MIDYNEIMTDKQKARFYEKIDDSGGPDSCHPWTGTKSWYGHGVVYLDNVRHIASRIAWSLHHGRAIPDGYYICHHCDNPGCQNVQKCLFLGTQKHNMEDAVRKGRMCRGSARPETHLNEDLVYLARLIYQKGLMTVAKIARWYDIHHVTCRDMLLGTTWKHVPMPQEEEPNGLS